MIKRLCILFTFMAGIAAAQERTGASFKAGTGVSLSDESRASIGLKIIEVEERTLAAETKITAQVYDVSERDGIAHASCLVSLKDNVPFQSGQTAAIFFPAASTGTIVRIDETLKKSTGQSELLISIPIGELKLRVGDFVRAVLTGEDAEDVTVIPEDAVLRTAYGDFAFVLNGSALLRTPIETGAAQGGYIEIVDGLYSGDEVAIGAADSLYQIELRATKGGGHCH